jgi:dTMP kinase
MCPFIHGCRKIVTRFEGISSFQPNFLPKARGNSLFMENPPYFDCYVIPSGWHNYCLFYVMGKKEKKKKAGILIVFEGISASGKSEIIKSICEDPLYKDQTVVLQWNSNPRVKKINSFFLAREMYFPGLYSFLQCFVFLLDYLVKFRKYLKRDYIVIADRYFFTPLARNRANGKSNFFLNYFIRLFRIPDLLFFVDTHPLVSGERIKMRKKPFFHFNRTIHENNRIRDKATYYLTRLREEYLFILENPQFPGKIPAGAFFPGRKVPHTKINYIPVCYDNNPGKIHARVREFLSAQNRVKTADACLPGILQKGKKHDNE